MPATTLKRRIMSWLLTLIAAYLLVLAFVWWGQERLLFAPAKLAPDHRFDLGADVHETWVPLADARLHALHLRLPKPRGVVFYLHGNAGNLQGWFTNADFYRQANFDLFMLDYRGYGKSSGRITSQAQLEADVRAAWDFLAAHYEGVQIEGVQMTRVVFGRSLGSGLATGLAAQVQPELTVLVSPYESMAALASHHYPWVPVALLRYPLRSDLALPRIKTPVWLAHGELDTLIPVQHAQRLSQRMPAITLVQVPGAGHNDVHLFEPYLQGLRRALAATGALRS